MNLVICDLCLGGSNSSETVAMVELKRLRICLGFFPIFSELKASLRMSKFCWLSFVLCSNRKLYFSFVCSTRKKFSPPWKQIRSLTIPKLFFTCCSIGCLSSAARFGKILSILARIYHDLFAIRLHEAVTLC